MTDSTTPAGADDPLVRRAQSVMRMENILSDVRAERGRQDEKWGGPAHDDKHSAAEWVELIHYRAGRARAMAGAGDVEQTEHHLIQVAAIAVAAVEASQRQRGA